METFDLIPLRYLNEYVYCPRLGYLEMACGEFEDNEFTVDGAIKHRAVETEKGKDREDDVGRMTSLLLSSERLGIIGKIDLLESDGAEFTPVEYKRGNAPNREQKVYEPEKVQLCAQGLLLRDNGYNSNKGYVYFADSHRRVEVVFDEELICRTYQAIEGFREILARVDPPPPLQDSPKCFGCSLNKICLPDETLLLAKREKAGKDSVAKTRRLVPARDDALPLYVLYQGASVGKAGDRLVLRSEPGKTDYIRLNDISQLCVFGNVQVSTQAMRELLYRDKPIAYFSRGGWFYGIAHAHSNKNAILRINQISLLFDDKRRTEVAGRIINGKIRNCRTLVRRNAGDEAAGTCAELARLASKATRCSSLQELLGVEGLAAHLYFQAFASLLKGRKGKALRFDFQTRMKRPAPDPVNAMLSYGYSLLLKDCLVTLLAVGFDPYIGFYHQPKYGKPALALDLMEEFRPLVVDSVVLTLLNNGEVGEHGFVSRLGSVFMKERTKRVLIDGYERRMDTTIKHPLFGYAVSYRRVLEIQARLLARYVNGELAEYIPFCTR
ncbi:MAG: CRISPR-associated endonuclease Cas1 [Candidatus Hadarchaeales archaeon]